MKIEQKIIAAIIAGSLSLSVAAHADNENKTQSQPAGADASSQTQSDSAGADAQLQIQKEPAGAEVDSSSKDIEAQADVKIDEAAGAEADEQDAKTPEKFAKKALQGGLMEVKAGQLAAQKAESSSVKQYGDKLARDHQKACDQLKPIAQKKGITVSDQLEQKHQAHLDHLSRLSGEQFDKEFLKQAAMHHKKDIKMFEQQSKEGEDPSIRSFASETLPVLREHLKIAEQLQEDRNASIPELREPAGAESPEKADPGVQPQPIDQSQQKDDSSSAAQDDPAGAQSDAQKSDTQSSEDASKTAPSTP